MVDHHVEGFVVAVDDGGGAAVGQAQLLLHVDLERVEFLDGLFDDAHRVFADHHVVLSDLLGHEVNFLLDLLELVDQSLGLLLVPHGFHIQHLLHVLQRFYLVTLVFGCLVHAGHANDGLVLLAVKIKQIFVVAADGFISQEGQEVGNVFLGLVDVLERVDVEFIEVELVVDLLQVLQNQVGVLRLVL